MAQDTGLSEQVAQLNRGQDTIWVLLTGSLVFFIENLGLKPRRFTTALPLNTSAFTKYMLKCETWKKPIRFDFTPHQNKSRYCGAPWAV
jgi:putative transposase